MKKLNAIFIIPLMLLGAFLVPSLGHASTGVVSVNGGNLVPGSASPSTVSVPIQISGSDLFSGFDIQVVADTAFLQGASISLAGSILPSPSLLVECINGVLVAGTSCGAQAGFGVVQVAAANTVAQQTTTGTGLLFTITYNVVGNSPGTPISFNTGCVQTSVASGDCVTIANGGVTAVPETDQGATFSNVIGFSMTTQFPKYSTTASTPIGITINYASQGGYLDLLTETSSVAPAGVTCSFASGSPGTADLLDFATTSDVLTCSGPAGSYSVGITAMGQGIDSPPMPIVTHTINVPLLIGSPDFSVGLSQSSVTIPAGGSDSSTNVVLTGLSGFSGTVSTSGSTGGITASAPMATLSPDASGYSSASPALTITVASTVSPGSYPLTVTSISGSHSHSAMITVVVPAQDFSVFAVPNNIGVVRGGTVALNVNINSIGNFHGAVSLSASISPIAGQIDNGCPGTCLTNNITPAFSPATATLTPGGSLTIFFFASTVGGDAAVAANTATATGNYQGTISATINGITHSAPINFNVMDFTIGPGFCTGGNFVQTSPDSLSASILTNTTATGGDIAGQLIGTPCGSLTITDQPNPQFPYLDIFSAPSPVLWVSSNAYGGFVTNGFDGLPSVSAINQALPFNGIAVPQLGAAFGPAVAKVCMVATFWPNGTQIPYSYLAANGPIILPSSGLYPFLAAIGAVPVGTSNWGCRFDNAVYPHDVGNDPEFNAFENSNAKGSGHFGACPPNFDPSTPCDYQNVNNADFWGVTAMALQGTLAGDYTFKQCASNGSVQHCQTYTLHVVKAPSVHQLVSKSSYSFSGTNGQISFKFGVSNLDTTHAIYIQATANGVGSFGDSFSVSTGVIKINPGANANNLAFTVPITSNEIGESFTFSFSIAVGTDANNLDGTSTLQAISRTFTITA